MNSGPSGERSMAVALLRPVATAASEKLAGRLAGARRSSRASSTGRRTADLLAAAKGRRDARGGQGGTGRDPGRYDQAYGEGWAVATGGPVLRQRRSGPAVLIDW